ncbi:MAG: ABC transporter permease [Blastocatellia bacterium]
METLIQDLRYGLRAMLKSRGFTAVAIIALALGIGANTAIFSVVNTVLLRPLPFKDPDRLVAVIETKLPQFPEFTASPGNFIDWQKQNTVFEQIEAVRQLAYNLSGAGEPERIRSARVTAGMFDMLGIKPAQGRGFLPEEDQAGHENVAVISHALWQRRFGGDPNVLSQTMTLNAQSYTIIGVMPPGVEFPDRNTELWTPMAFTSQQSQQHGSHFISVSGRLKPGATLDQAQTEMSTIAGRLAEQYPNSNAGWDVKILPMQDYQVRDIKPALVVLLCAVALVLLIACANVANLLLARATAREKEMAIRAALGAGRFRIARQLLTESLLLAVIGGGAGLVLAVWGIDALLALAPEGLPRVKDVSIDSGAMMFTLAISLLTGLVFGLAPVLQASHPNLNESLKEGGKGSSGGPRRQRIRNALVVIEVSMALVLLVGAGLMFRSFVRLQQVSPGFNPANALMVAISLPQGKYQQPAQQKAFFDEVIENVSALPGVVSVGATESLPMSGDYVYGFEIEGRPPAAPGEDISTNYYSVTPDYFRAMGIQLLRGRLFTDRDRDGAQRVAIINESMAKRIFPDEDPIGKRIALSNESTAYREIVGIVNDVKQYGLAEATPLQTYEPFAQKPFSSMLLVVRGANDPSSLGGAIRSQVFAVDKDQPVSRIITLEELVSGSVARQRFAMVLFAIFAGVAMALAGVGLYGVMSYSVTQRTHEIGIRMALGAQPGDILRVVIRQGATLALIGIAIGLAGAFVLTKLVSSVLSGLLFGVSSTDALTFTVIPVILLGVALGASYAPARRAAKADPLVALRHE